MEDRLRPIGRLARGRGLPAALTASMRTGMETHQVFDLSERLIEVTEHRAGIYACHHCRGVTRAEFPTA